MLSIPYAALAAAITALAVAQGYGRSAPVALVAAAGTSAVAFGHRWPLLTSAVGAASVAGQAMLHDGDPVFGSFIALMAACYALGRRAATPVLAAGLGLLAGGVAVLLAADPSLRRPVELVFPLVYFSGATALGRLVRSRERSSTAALEAAELAASARELAVLAEERARIAREMHDVVAHSVSLLVLQAESAAAVLADDPDRARTQLDRVAAGGRQALEELRRLLGVLRSDEDAAATGPQPDLAQLEALADTVRATGRTVDVQVDPGLDALSPGLQLTAYRVVQEALTNAVRHGDADRIEVRLSGRSGALRIEVVDDGRTRPGAWPAGHGLTGMRERLRLYDGELEAGPRPDGGWSVAARVRTTA